MLTPLEFIKPLKENGIRMFTGVPCSFFQAAINTVIDDPDLRYFIVPNEGAGLALASGAEMAGEPSALLIQNSGFGNLVNPLTSLNMIYRLPVLLFISGRAYGISDEPQHEIMGKTMGPVLKTMGVRFEDMPSQAKKYQAAVHKAVEWMKKESSCFVFFVRQGSIEEYSRRKKKEAEPYSLKRIEAIEIIARHFKGNDTVVATTGKSSRELFSVADRPQNFYMQGSMGHAASIGLGVALSKPEKRVIILDGDGALLMHMGVLSSVGHYKPDNYYHIILDNESYETTGDQDTTSHTTDFAAIAKSCGYRAVYNATSVAELESTLPIFLKEKGPAFLRVKINRLPTKDIPRISSKHSSEAIAKNFRKSLSR